MSPQQLAADRIYQETHNCSALQVEDWSVTNLMGVIRSRQNKDQFILTLFIRSKQLEDLGIKIPALHGKS